MGCTSSSLKGTSPNTAVLNTPAAALHQTLSTTDDPQSYTHSYSSTFVHDPLERSSAQAEPGLDSKTETKAKTQSKSNSKARRFPKRSQPSDEEMLRYTGMTNAEMKTWAAQPGPNEKRAYQREVTSPAGFDPLVAGAAVGGVG